MSDMKKILFFAAVLMLGFVACSSDDEMPDRFVSVTGIEFSYTQIAVEISSPYRHAPFALLEVKILPVNATSQSISWTSSNTKVCE